MLKRKGENKNPPQNTPVHSPDPESEIVSRARAVTNPSPENQQRRLAREALNDDVMEDLASEYSRFAQLVAHGQVQPRDYTTLNALCNQVRASIEALEEEAKRRRRILDKVVKSIEVLTTEDDEEEETES